MSTVSQQLSTSLPPRTVPLRPKLDPLKRPSPLRAASLSPKTSDIPHSSSASPSSSTTESPSSETSDQAVSPPSSPSSDPLASSSESPSQPRFSSTHRANQSYRSHERPRSVPLTNTSSSAPASTLPLESMEVRHVEKRADSSSSVEDLDPPSSSPRRPRRPGTAMPDRQRQPPSVDSIGGLGVLRQGVGNGSSGALTPARDEFEKHFLNRVSIDRDAQLINDVLEGVNFRQLSDDEEVLSEDNASLSRSSTAPRNNNTEHHHHLLESGALKPNVVADADADEDDFDPEFDTIDLQRSSTVHSDWRNIPTEVGCRDCDGCTRLYAENRRLRRQLDELEFELASNVVHSNEIADSYDPPELVSAIPSNTRFSPSVKKKGRSWTSRLLGSASISLTSSSSKVSEKAMLKSQVQALTVTTEYLWRKLNKAEIELRDYRLRDLRAKMKMSSGKRNTPTGTARNSRSVDWSWK